MEPEYIRANRVAYNATAEEFREKIGVRKAETTRLVERFGSYIDRRFSTANILELGPGAGYASYLLSEKGYQVKSIELSPNMAAIARETSTQSEVIIGEFLKHDFTDVKFTGILAIAFIHLFPYQDARSVLNKVLLLLETNGIFYVSTTKHRKPGERYDKKDNFREAVKRYRRRYTKKELEDLLLTTGFKIIEYSEEQDIEGRIWMNYITGK
ncbi:hypothetical protein COV16_05770 [Candidatus Woesearchaeota archaeon CG10_big_fil_rev_8_21_14_0_10_34_8]|nr:MAG: hypothetical protein COV16_05770 [Candidatus Woesearchaeota archaeon CG10_big_fil_rev_8_21_14_0_10_34_8]